MHTDTSLKLVLAIIHIFLLFLWFKYCFQVCEQL